MLFQLVCSDRRYSRLNCFNIREYESLLKRKFFKDLINITDNHLFLNNTILSLRYKNHNNLDIHNDQFIFYNYPITNLPKYKNIDYITYTKNILFKFYEFNSFLINFFINYSLNFNTNLPLSNIYILFNNIKGLFYKSYVYIYYLLDLDILKILLISNFNINLTYNLNYIKYINNFFKEQNPNITPKIENINNNFLLNNYLFNESNKNYRYVRYYNPLISYDYKTGHYIGIWDQLYPHLITSFIEIARGIRKAP
jgi:hypothetical protein